VNDKWYALVRLSASLLALKLPSAHCWI